MTICFSELATHQIRHQATYIKWAVSLVIAYGHFNVPWGCVFGCMGYELNCTELGMRVDVLCLTVVCMIRVLGVTLGLANNMCAMPLKR